MKRWLTIWKLLVVKCCWETFSHCKQLLRFSCVARLPIARASYQQNLKEKSLYEEYSPPKSHALNIKTVAKHKVWLYVIRRTTRSGYSGIFRLFLRPNLYLNQVRPSKNTCQVLQPIPPPPHTHTHPHTTKKIPAFKISKPKKSVEHPIPSLPFTRSLLVFPDLPHRYPLYYFFNYPLFPFSWHLRQYSW